MIRLISNVHKIPITVKHISGKFKLNPVADHQSRFPSDCSFDNCWICNYVSDTVHSVLDPAARCSAVFSQLADLNNNSIYSDNFRASCTNRQAWKSVQHSSNACKNVIKYLQTGREPTKNVGDIFNKIRQYVREASRAKDGHW